MLSTSVKSHSTLLLLFMTVHCYLQSVKAVDSGGKIDGILELNCTEIWQQNGCYSSYEYTKCDEKFWLLGQTLDLMPIMYDVQPVVVIMAVVEAFRRVVSSGEVPVEFLTKHASGLSNEQQLFTLGSMIPGLWTLDELVEAGTVLSSLGLALNDTECCNITFARKADGQVYMSGDVPEHWEATVTGIERTCQGNALLWVDSVCCRYIFMPEQKNTSLFQQIEEGQLPHVQVVDSLLRGGCNVSTLDLLSAIETLVPYNYMLKDELDMLSVGVVDGGLVDRGTLSGWALDVAVTWFVAESSAAGCLDGWDDDEVDGRVEVASAKEQCCLKCKSILECTGYRVSEGDVECVLDNVTSVTTNSFPDNGTQQLLGVSGERYHDSRYLLYHMLPGSYCEDDLVAAGSVNTLLGMTTGEKLPLTFDRNADGKVTVTAASSRGTGVNTVTACVLDHYSSCRSVIYILSDDFFPPDLPEDVEVEPRESAWHLISNITRSFHLPVMEEGCFKPLFSHADSSDMDSSESVPPGSTETTDNSSSVNSNDATHGGETQSDGGGGLSGGTIAALMVATLAGLAIVSGVTAALIRRTRHRPVHFCVTTSVAKGRQYGSGKGLRWPSLEVTGSTVTDGNELTGTGTLSETGFAKATVMKDYLTTVPKDWVLDNVKVVKKIAAGSFGEVYVCEWHDCLVAVKRFTFISTTPDDDDMADTPLKVKAELMAMQEVSLMSGLRHPNVVQFLGVLTDPPSVVMEYCQQGSLFKVLRKAEADPAFMAQLDWRRRLLMAKDIAKGMQYLHSRAVPIIHRDLKSANLLVNKAWNVKVTDFGLSKLLDLASSARTTLMAINPRWLAPELISVNGPCGRSTTGSDVYAFGIILWELLTCKEPYKGLTPAMIMFSVVHNGIRPPLPTCHSDLPGDQTYSGLDNYIHLMQRCWAQDPASRPDFKTITEELGAIRQAVFASATAGLTQASCSPSPTVASTSLPHSSSSQ